MNQSTSGRLPASRPPVDLRPVLVHVFRDPEISGSQRVALDILGDRALSPFRRVVICGSEAAASERFVDELEQLEIERVHIESLRREVGVQDVRAVFELRRNLKSLNAVLVHTHSAKPFLLAGLAAWTLRVPRRVHTLHGISFHRFTPAFRRLLFFCLEQLGSLFYHRIVSVNNYYRKYFPLARVRGVISVIPNGISLPRELPQAVPTPDNEFAILFAGRLDEQKDPIFLLDVAEAINHYWDSGRVPHFYIAGSGPLSDRVAAEIESRGLTKSVSQLGWMTNLSTHYAAANVVFLTSRWEACGLVLIEAAAHGCPAVAADVEGVPEFVRHECNGLLFEQGNVSAACQSLARIARDDAFRDRLATTARVDAQSRSNTEMVCRYLDVYRKSGLKL